MQVIEFTPTQADTAAAHRRHSLDRFLSRPSFVTLLIVVAIMGGLALAVLPSGYKGLSVLVVLAAALGGVAFPLATIRVRVPALAKRLHRQRAKSQSPIIMSWSDDGLTARTPTANSVTPWAHYFRWREDGQVILLYLTEVLFQFIPKRVLSSEQLASLRALAVSAGVPGARR